MFCSKGLQGTSRRERTGKDVRPVLFFLPAASWLIGSPNNSQFTFKLQHVFLTLHFSTVRPSQNPPLALDLYFHIYTVEGEVSAPTREWRRLSTKALLQRCQLWDSFDCILK